jgi:hypothetical protein
MQELNEDTVAETEVSTETAAAPADAMPTISTRSGATVPPGKRLVHPLDLYLEREAGGTDFFEGDFLNFNGQTNEWTRGPDKEPVGATVPFLVNLAGLAVGRVKIVDGKIVDREIGLVRDGYQRKPREELDDYDESCWRTDKRGKRTDPWLNTTYVPMRCLEDGEPVVYGPFSDSARNAIKQFVKTCRRTDLDGKDPIVLLRSTNFKNTHGGVTYKPHFEIVGDDYWEPGIPASPMTPIAVPAVAPAAAKPIAKAVIKELPKRKDDMDDEIPF